jgi:hypothetical protein
VAAYLADMADRNAKGATMARRLVVVSQGKQGYHWARREFATR